MPNENETAFLHQVLRGNRSAVEFCQSLFRVSQTLDDMIDGDKNITQNQVMSAFWQSLIEIPGNPFYRANEAYLRPMMAMALQDWRDSVFLERSGDEHQQTLAFVLRDQLTGVVVQCAYLVGGEAWMEAHGPKIRAHFHEDTLGDYLTDLQKRAALQTPTESQ